VKHFGEGCACPMGGLSKDFLSSLKLGPKDVAVIDTEAGVEHLGRGVASGVDVILLVLDPSYESIRLSEKISAMAKEGGKSVHFVFNKMDKATADKILNKIGKERVVGFIPFSQPIQDKGLSGEELDTAVADIAEVTSFVLRTSQGGVNLSFDFDHSEKLLKFRLMAVSGVNNGILRIADLIKPCNQSGKSVIKNKPETRLPSEQRVWCGGWDLNPRTPTRQGPKPCSFDQTGRPPPTKPLRLENTSSSFNILLTVGTSFSLLGSHKLIR
jgi:hypothetical protein